MPDSHGSDIPQQRATVSSSEGEPGRDVGWGATEPALRWLASSGLGLYSGRYLQVFLGWSWPGIAILMLLGAGILQSRPANGDLPGLALATLILAALGCSFQLFWYWLLTPRTGLKGAGAGQSEGGRAGVVITAAGIRELDVLTLGLDSDGPAARSGKPWARWIQLVLGPLLLAKLGVFAWVAHWVWEAAAVPTSETLMVDHSLTPQRPFQIAAAVWLVQAFVTAMPLPGTQGHAMLEATAGLLLAPTDRVQRWRVVRLLEGLIAVGCVCVGLVLWRFETPLGLLPLWPAWVCLGVLVWVARNQRSGGLSTGDDLADLVTDAERSTATVETRRATSAEAAPLQQWWQRRRVRRALRSERDEASDAARADEILDKLHRDGADSLTHQEKALLRRVSQRIREEKKVSGTDLVD